MALLKQGPCTVNSFQYLQYLPFSYIMFLRFIHLKKAAVVHSSSQLHNILCVTMTILQWIYPSLCHLAFGLSTGFATLNTTAVYILRGLLVHMCKKSSRKHQDRVVSYECNNTMKYSPKWLFAISPAMSKTNPLQYVVLRLLNFYNPVSINGISLVLICIFLITSGTELLFLCLLDIHVSSSVKCMFCFYCLVSN